jgi:hypothetical protein
MTASPTAELAICLHSLAPPELPDEVDGAGVGRLCSR